MIRAPAVVLVGSLAMAACSRSGEDAAASGAARCLSMGEDRDEWAGETGVRKVEFWKAVAWDYGAGGALALEEPPRDLSTHSSFRFVLDHAAPTDRSWELFVESDDPATDEVDGWRVRRPLDFKGAMRVVVHRDEMEAVGRPVGWGAVGGLRFGTTPPSGAAGTLGVAALHLVDVARAGIVLRDAALFDALDLEREGLEEVGGAVRDGDLDLAVARLGAYLRARPSRWVFAFDEDLGDDALDLDGAAAIARGSIKLMDVRHDFPGGEVDWHFNATNFDPAVDYSRQWASRLNDMKFWHRLCKAYLATGDDVYVEGWLRQLRGFLRSCPFEDEPVERFQSRPWHAMRAANRMRKSWPDAFEAFRASPLVTDRDLVDFLKSSLEQGRHLRKNHDEDAGEHRMFEMLALFTVGAFFPELSEATEWRRYALAVTDDGIEDVFYPDGFANVLSPAYHARGIRTVRRIHDKAVELGFADEVPAGLLDRLDGAVTATVMITAPDRTLPTLNDSTDVDVLPELAAARQMFPGRDDLRWFVTEGAEGAPPAATSHSFEWAGYHVMRSGWGRDAHMLVFDDGPMGSSHQHQDKLSVALWAYGRRVLYDGGGGEYEESAWREYATDTLSHNSVVVDGMGQRRRTGKKKFELSRAPIDSRWSSDAARDFAAGRYDDKYGASTRKYDEVAGEKLAVHTRRVVFAKPDLFVVADTLRSRDGEPHAYEARWHLLTTNVTSPIAGVVVTSDPELPNLAVVPLDAAGLEVRTASGQVEPERLGWHVMKYQAEQRRPTTTVVHARRGGGTQRFLTLLMPLRAGEACPVEAVDGATVRLRGGGAITVEASEDPDGDVRVVDERRVSRSAR